MIDESKIEVGIKVVRDGKRDDEELESEQTDEFLLIQESEWDERVLVDMEDQEEAYQKEHVV